MTTRTSVLDVTLAIQLLSPRRDNSKGTIIVLFNTNRVYESILNETNDILIDIVRNILIWIGNPESHLR